MKRQHIIALAVLILHAHSAHSFATQWCKAIPLSYKVIGGSLYTVSYLYGMHLMRQSVHSAQKQLRSSLLTQQQRVQAYRVARDRQFVYRFLSVSLAIPLCVFVLMALSQIKPRVNSPSAQTVSTINENLPSTPSSVIIPGSRRGLSPRECSERNIVH